MVPVSRVVCQFSRMMRHVAITQDKIWYLNCTGLVGSPHCLWFIAWPFKTFWWQGTFVLVNRSTVVCQFSTIMWHVGFTLGRKFHLKYAGLVGTPHHPWFMIQVAWLFKTVWCSTEKLTNGKFRTNCIWSRTSYSDLQGSWIWASSTLVTPGVYRKFRSQRKTKA